VVFRGREGGWHAVEHMVQLLLLLLQRFDGGLGLGLGLRLHNVACLAHLPASAGHTAPLPHIPQPPSLVLPPHFASCSPVIPCWSPTDQKTMKCEYENALVLVMEKKISG
jgi:hypothetical protein